VSLSENDLRVTLLQYLSGKSTELERAHFEERLLADQEFSDAAAVCEQELIDSYALQRLDVEDMEALKSWIEVSPSRMQRVRMARALLLARPQRFRRKQRIAVILAVAACVLAAVTLHLTNRITQKDSRAVSQVTATNAIPSQSASTPPSVAVPSNTSKPDVILIATERVRGEQQIVTYQVHRDAPIQLQILLTGETARSGYRLWVVPLEEQRHILLEKTDMKAQSVNGQLYLKVTLPPGSLPPATYAASVSRRGDTLVSHFTLKWSQE
jgi:negative regulator of sigma E activity